MDNSKKTMEKIVALCKGRGFIYPGSEIYGGLANTWDYGPLGMALKNNIKQAWLKKFVQENKYNVGLDSAILMNPQTWVASGHLGGFSEERLKSLMEQFDFVEVFNACESEEVNEKARKLARKYHKPGFGGSDAHRLECIGMAYTKLPDNIRCESDLRL